MIRFGCVETVTPCRQSALRLPGPELRAARRLSRLFWRIPGSGGRAR